ncbi:MAG: alpha/beta hydrolase [Alphaproteobacteria bacterium]|nr:alpha/beta hydrolase [Alphaproteobacteria bacterium]
MPSSEQPNFLTVGSGAQQRSIAYLARPGKAPGVFWLQGFKSDMVSTKATALAEWTTKRGTAYTRFDYSGHGQSGGRFEDGTIGRWLEESAAVFDQVTDGPQIIVGSSMGGHLALLLLRKLRAEATNEGSNRIGGVVLIAPAWDMTEELMWKNAGPEARRAILEDGVWYRPSQYGEPYAITRGLIEEGRNHLLGTTPWDPGRPVEIIHGRLDPDVPFSHSERLIKILRGAPVNLTEVPDGEHRLSRPQDLDLLFEKINKLAA